MEALDDLSICKRIAEINGDSGDEFMGVFIPSLHFKEAVSESYNNSYSFCIDRYAYNPLTDDALCFQLMVKYDIRVESFEPTLKDGSDGYEYHCYKQGTLNYAYNTLSIDKSPNKAICLAIIEAHKENV